MEPDVYKFDLKAPCWALAHEQDDERMGVWAEQPASMPGNGKILTLCSDFRTAEMLADSWEDEQIVPFEIADLRDIPQLIEQVGGVTSVEVHMDDEDSRLYPLAEFNAHIESAINEPTIVTR